MPRVRLLESQVWLPLPPERVFPFFAEAVNLNAITPPWVHFRILTPGPIEMRVGALIDYQIRLRVIPITWRTTITRWEPPHAFCDEQLRGPYTLWKHTHTFVAQDGGTLCLDRVEYSHLGGPLVHRLFVRPELDRIFAYRRERLQELFSPETLGSLTPGRSHPASPVPPRAGLPLQDHAPPVPR